MQRLASYGRIAFLVCGSWLGLPDRPAAASNLFITNYSNTIQANHFQRQRIDFRHGLGRGKLPGIQPQRRSLRERLGDRQYLRIHAQRTASTFASGLRFPRGLTFDAGGNLYVADVWSGQIDKYTPSGQESVFASGLGNPETMAFDRNGNLFVADGNNTNAIIEFTPSGGSQSTFANTGFSQLDGSIAFSPSGNLFVGDSGDGIVYEFTPSGQRSIFASGFPSVALGCLAFGSNGDLFVADGPSGYIYEFTPSGQRSTFASGFSAADGLAFAPTPVPEPSTFGLLGVGIIGLAAPLPIGYAPLYPARTS